MEKPTIAKRSPAVLELEPGTYFWCACGKSAKQPFCDGAHKGSPFKPMKLEIAEKRQVALCRCKQTQSPPFCDGTHGNLPRD